MMQMDVSEQPIKLMRQSSVDFFGLDALLSATPMTPDEMTDVAINVTNDLDEDIQELYWNGAIPSNEMVLSLPAVNLPQFLERMLKHGLDPNHFEYKREGYGRNILDEVGSIHAACIQQPSMLMLLEHGADPNISSIKDDFESIFDDADFFPSQFPGEMDENPWIFYRWLLLMAYGGICSKGHEPVTMLGGRSKCIFRCCNRFWYRFKPSTPNGSTEDKWYLHIYDKVTNENVAYM